LRNHSKESREIFSVVDNKRTFGFHVLIEHCLLRQIGILSSRPQREESFTVSRFKNNFFLQNYKYIKIQFSTLLSSSSVIEWSDCN